ncbi:methyltransferase [Stutzerimonas balearica]|uniref:methyltransferase n=1 Tax=Stutzerimonas balearica TaxID=74829 RepID=UPI003786FABC
MKAHVLLRVLCGLCFLGLSGVSTANTLTLYYAKFGSYVTPHQASIASACKALISGLGVSRVYKAASGTAEAGDCISAPSTSTTLNEKYGTYHQIFLECPNGSTDGLTCDQPPANQCETTNGQTVSHEHLMKSAVGQPTIDPPGSVCGNGCQYAFTYTPASNVYVYSSGNPPGVFGIYSYTGNGIECTENTLQTPGNPSEGETQDPDDTPPPEDGDKCPAGYIYNGTFCSPENPPEEPDPTDPTDPTDPENPTDPDDGSGGGGGGGGDDSGGGDGGDDGSDDGTGGGEGDGSGGGTGGSGDGSGEGDGEEGEEDSGSGPGFCDGDDCSFVAPTYFDGAETVPGFEESLAHVFDGIRSSPLGSAVGAISFPSGSGVCPSGTVMLFGRPITFDGHCTLWGEISGIFSALMLAVWCLLGVRIVLSS